MHCLDCMQSDIIGHARRIACLMGMEKACLMQLLPAVFSLRILEFEVNNRFLINLMTLIFGVYKN